MVKVQSEKNVAASFEYKQLMPSGTIYCNFKSSNPLISIVFISNYFQTDVVQLIDDMH